MGTILAAVISGAVTLVVCMINNHAQAEKTRALLDYRLSELEKKVDKLYSGEITIDAVPAAWQEEIQRRVDERIQADGEAEEQPISAEEAMDIILGGT